MENELMQEKKFGRNFTHLTIPAEIWLRRDLSIQAKCLWAEVRSLHDMGKGGCYASDEYLCEFLQVKRRRLYEIFKELKKADLLETVSNDGRKAIRRAIVPPVHYSDADRESAQQKCGKLHSTSAGFCTAPSASHIDYKKEDNKEKKVANPSDSPPSPEAMAFVSAFFERLKKKNPSHKKPNLERWAKEIEAMMRIDKRSYEDAYKILEWADSQTDDFWPIAFQSPKSLRKLFDRALIKMKHVSGKDEKQLQDEKKKLQIIDENKKWAQFLKKVQFDDEKRMIVHDNSVAICLGRERAILGYADEKFKNIIINKLKNWGLPYEKSNKNFI